MPRYLLSVHTTESASQPSMTDEDARRGFEVVATLEAEMRAADALIFSGRLTEPSAASVIDARNGSTLTTDGPFVEVKESIGGFYIIEAADLAAAQTWAAKTSAAIQMPIEVRPFFATKA